ncbi:PREDICTED: NADH dehydrogenase [ubiquinone] 1 alpha subcomplex subunit 7-like [Polistes dominula]|uniref:NADH dehydrogenase [ubiquinone] 1 alpha subcomplex subunit 7 n=1 Tax=Polistes dominula TaxID=743375 RepID=A0ABM1IIU3_POLDO|nr:PREDICTED: NADH dehydrogenase [ubiquinone] 1 alpha subcomplex subunit 7-like [Polistes dominula]
MVEHRAVTPIIEMLRRFLRGKPVATQLRYADLIAARTQPPPEVPGGPHHVTSKVYYYTRDGRREVKPPIEVLLDKQITAGSEQKSVGQKYITPGKRVLHS